MFKFSGLRIFIGIVAAAVIAVVGTGLFLAGTPSRERERRFDEQRTAALQQIFSVLQRYWELNLALPQALDEIKGKPDYYLASLNDPETGTPYEYNITDTGTYDLCAVFALASSGDTLYPRPLPERYGGTHYEQDFWKHKEGRHCFSFQAAKPVGANCTLMKHQDSGYVGCFGCANRICKDPAEGYKIYSAPFEKEYVGVRYSCIETEEGCALVQ